MKCVREAFHDELASLDEELAGMCELATTAMRQSDPGVADR